MMLQCPICHVGFVRQVLENYEVLARCNSDTRVGGLEVLTCSNGHIFFVRKSDLCTERAAGAAA
jgi:hypothetical protein